MAGPGLRRASEPRLLSGISSVELGGDPAACSGNQQPGAKPHIREGEGQRLAALGWAGLFAPGPQGHGTQPWLASDSRFEINFLSETGDIVFHIKPRFSSATMVANAFQGGRWGQEEASSVFPLVLGEPFEMEVSSDAEHFHVHAQEHKVLQFAHRHRPLAAITRVQVLSDHRLAQVELARKGLCWGWHAPAAPAGGASGCTLTRLCFAWNLLDPGDSPPPSLQPQPSLQPRASFLRSEYCPPRQPAFQSPLAWDQFQPTGQSGNQGRRPG
ncbi:hypothetical protein ABFV05_018323 [Capra hircus]